MDTSVIQSAIVSSTRAAAATIGEKYTRANTVEITRGDPLKWLLGDSLWHAIDRSPVAQGEEAAGYQSYLLSWFLDGVKIKIGFSFNDRTVSIEPLVIEHVASGVTYMAHRVNGGVAVNPIASDPLAKEIATVFIYLTRILYGKER